MEIIQLSACLDEPLTHRTPAAQLPLFNAANEAELYHSSGFRGFFAHLVRKPGERMRQCSYRIDALHQVLDRIPEDRDSWISQAEFFKPNRRVVNLLRLNLLFCDIDTYRVAHLQGRPVDELVNALLIVCDDEGIPVPSLVVFSGRGIQAKWLLEEALPRAALPRWNACQRYLVSKLSLIGGDQAAKDASRVLRVVCTRNLKSNEIVRLAHITEAQGEPVRYDFDYLAECLLPYSREQIADFRAAAAEKAERKTKLRVIQGGKSGNLRGFSSRQLAWDRLEDLRKLAELRGGVREGQRMLHLHWRLNFLLLSGATHSGQMFYEAEALAREIMGGWQHRPEELSTLYQRAQQMEAGETVEWNGRRYPPLYTPSNATLIDLFEIASSEQRQLKTIISQSLAKERHAERERARRREAGAVSREEYEANSISRQKPWESLGMSRSAWYRAGKPEPKSKAP